MAEEAKPPPPPEPKPAAPKPPAAGGEKVVLVVDDKGTTRNILLFNLRNEGYKAVEAENGFQALKLLTEQKVDLVILDVMMPKMDGYTVCEKIRGSEQTKDIPVVMCTAKGMKEDVVQAIHAGANDYVVKPFSKATILEKVRKYIGEVPKPAAPPKPEKDTTKKNEAPPAKPAEAKGASKPPPTSSTKPAEPKPPTEKP